MKIRLQKAVAGLSAMAPVAAALNTTALAAGSPYTGDNSMVGIMLGVAGVALAGIILFFFTGKKK